MARQRPSTPLSPLLSYGGPVKTMPTCFAFLAVVVLLLCVAYSPQVFGFLYANLAFELELLVGPARTACVYERHGWGTAYRGVVAGGSLQDAGAGPGSPRVVLLVAYDKGITEDGWTEDHNERSVQNKRAYAQRHGYALEVGHFRELTDRPGGWGKLLMIKDAMQRYDIVAYLDIDTVIMNGEVRLEQMLEPGKDLASTADTSGINSGAMVFRSSDWSRWFLDELWAQEWLVEGPYPFKWDQRPFHYLLQTDKWLSSKSHHRGTDAHPFPPYPVTDPSQCPACPPADASDPRRSSEDILRHIRLLPQCAMNSFLLWPFSEKNRRRLEVSQYVSGDFVLHAAGYRGAFKAAVFDAGLFRAKPFGPGASGRIAGGDFLLLPFALLAMPLLFLFMLFRSLSRKSGKQGWRQRRR